ncbi:MAG: glycosyltransferase family 4 protein [Firmicutes bacterium]|nr:glycosyltransferase family 4 protein [Bacillota bacterium]
MTVITSLPYRGIDNQTRIVFLKNRSIPEFYKGAQIIRFPNPWAGRKGLWMKILEYGIFTFWILVSSMRFGRKADAFLVQSSPPFAGLFVSMATMMRRVPIIYNLQDLFPDSAIKSGILRGRWLIECLRYLEKLTYRRATVVTAISRSFADHVVSLSPGCNVVVLPNWIDVERIDYVPPCNNEFLTTCGLKGKFIVLYAGNIGFAQNLDVVVNAAAALRDNPEIVFVIVGDGQHKEAIQEKVRELCLSNVYIYPLQPEEKAAEVYSMAEIGLVTVRKGIGHSSIPSKTWMIMACRRPVLAAIDDDSELAKFLSTEELGITVPPDDPQALSKAIVMLYEDVGLRQRLGARGRHYVEQNLSRSLITSAYDRLIEKLVSLKR